MITPATIGPTDTGGLPFRDSLNFEPATYPVAAPATTAPVIILVDDARDVEYSFMAVRVLARCAVPSSKLTVPPLMSLLAATIGRT